MYILSHVKFLCVFNFVFLLSSCEYLDFCSVFSSETVDSRYSENKDYFDHPLPSIIDSEHFCFLIASDTHYYDEDFKYFGRLDKLREQHNAAFLIVNGDISQSGLKQQFEIIVSDMQNYNGIIYPILGNHDIYHNGSKNFGEFLGKYIYSFEIGATKLIFLDTASGTFGAKQKKWYEKQLSQFNGKHLLVFTHYNFIDGDIQEMTAISNAEDKYYFFNLNEKYHVDNVFSGHLHKNNKNTIRGVVYQTLQNLIKEKDAVLLISVDSTNLSVTSLDLPD